MVGRSMEFPIDTVSQICVIPRGSQIPFGTAKYGFIGINAYKIADAFVEGFNEKGLSFDGLMFTGAVYQPVLAGKSVPVDGFCSWALGNFATVDEVKAALQTVHIVASEVKKIKELGMHVAFHDAAGKNLVVEFIGGQIKVYDNPLGVMTNRPEFDWQMNNLRNYVNLDSHDKDQKMVNGVKVEATGVGSGMLGLPGDWTPPSRFVRVAMCLDAALQPKDADGAVVLTNHILNVVDIPKGVIKEGTPIPFVEMYGFAQWAVMKDLTNQVLYFKTYDNPAWKSIDLKKFDLSAGAPRKMIEMDDKNMTVIDVSGQLKGAAK